MDAAERSLGQQPVRPRERGAPVFIGCTGQTSANPPTYSSCAVPAGSSGFTAGDWTAVVNEALSEIYGARQVNSFFTQLSTLNTDTFLDKNAELPAIATSVGALGQAAGNNPTTLSPLTLFSTGLGIASSIAGVSAAPVSAALGISSYLAGIIPSASPTIAGPSFNSTLNNLQDDLADAVSDASAALTTQSSTRCARTTRCCSSSPSSRDRAVRGTRSTPPGWRAA